MLLLEAIPTRTPALPAPDKMMSVAETRWTPLTRSRNRRAVLVELQPICGTDGDRLVEGPERGGDAVDDAEELPAIDARRRIASIAGEVVRLR
jgi:hypothetical protein